MTNFKAVQTRGLRIKRVLRNVLAWLVIIWGGVRRALPWLLVASGITILAHNCGWLRGFEATSLDTFVRLNPVSAEHVYIVGISNSDYQNMFAGKSPLDPAKLVDLIKAAESGEPEVIVVDLNTSDPAFGTVRLGQSRTKVIWACGATPVYSDDPFEPDRSGGQELAGKPLFRTGRILGSDRNPTDALWGIAIFPQDPDGLVRRYCREVSVLEGGSREPTLAPTLNWAAVKAMGGAQENGGGQRDQEMILRLSADRQFLPRICASDLLSIDKGQGWKKAVKGKIVVIGAYYDAAHDRHHTCVGRMPGVELQAQAIESDLKHGGIRPVSPVVLCVAQIVVSVLVVAINCCYSDGWRPLVGFLAIPVAAFISSLVLSSSLYLWVDFVPVLFAVQMQYLFEHIKKVQQGKQDLAIAADRGAEEERSRLASDLHDDTQNRLFHVQVSLEPLLVIPGHGASVRNAQNTVREVGNNLEKIVNNLYPGRLEADGLCAELDQLAENLRERGIATKVQDNTDMLANRLDKDSQLRLFRIVEESVNNIIKHSQATRCEITMRLESRSFVLCIIDNGIGIGGPAKPYTGRGLNGMRTRAKLLGGTIQWDSVQEAAPRGTKVRVEMICPRKLYQKTSGSRS